MPRPDTTRLPGAPARKDPHHRRAPGGTHSLQLLLRLVIVVGLGIDAYVHLAVASDYEGDDPHDKRS